LAAAQQCRNKSNGNNKIKVNNCDIVIEQIFGIFHMVEYEIAMSLKFGAFKIICFYRSVLFKFEAKFSPISVISDVQK
jgi:hypothetical protein